jgi:hypothetical protein
MAVESSGRYSISLEIGERALLEPMLDAAVDVAISRALETEGHGILVTRHSHTSFTVELTTEVPSGITLERDARSLPS